MKQKNVQVKVRAGGKKWVQYSRKGQRCVTYRTRHHKRKHGSKKYKSKKYRRYRKNRKYRKISKIRKRIKKIIVAKVEKKMKFQKFKLNKHALHSRKQEQERIAREEADKIIMSAAIPKLVQTNKTSKRLNRFRK